MCEQEAFLLVGADPIIDRDKLEILDELGHGQFGRVCLGRMRIRNLVIMVAIKMSHMAPGQNEREKLIKEAMTMHSFHHDNVLRIIGVSFETDGSPLIVLPYMRNGSLLSYIQNNVNLDNRQLIQFAMDVAQGMVYLSSHRFIHRDLAARNCLLDDQMRVKVADFGLTKYTLDRNYYRMQTPTRMPIRYLAVECFDEFARFTTKTDVWSFGVLMWELLSRGKTPYEQFNRQFEIEIYVRGGRRLPQPRGSMTALYDLCLECWSADPNSRPDFEAIVHTLEIMMDSGR